MPAAKPTFEAKKIARGKDAGKFRVKMVRGKKPMGVDLGVRSRKNDVRRICDSVNGAYPIIYI